MHFGQFWASAVLGYCNLQLQDSTGACVIGARRAFTSYELQLAFGVALSRFSLLLTVLLRPPQERFSFLHVSNENLPPSSAPFGSTEHLEHYFQDLKPLSLTVFCTYTASWWHHPPPHPNPHCTARLCKLLLVLGRVVKVNLSVV